MTVWTHHDGGPRGRAEGSPASAVPSGDAVTRVIVAAVAPTEAARAAQRAVPKSRWRSLAGRLPLPVVERSVYWPIAVVTGTATGTGRRQWTHRSQGAIDLVTGRIGLLDRDVTRLRELPGLPEERVPPRLSRQQALESWHELFRDHVDRRFKPLRPPRLSLDSVEALWLEHYLVRVGEYRFLVDSVTGAPRDVRGLPQGLDGL